VAVLARDLKFPRMLCVAERNGLTRSGFLPLAPRERQTKNRAHGNNGIQCPDR